MKEETLKKIIKLEEERMRKEKKRKEAIARHGVLWDNPATPEYVKEMVEEAKKHGICEKAWKMMAHLVVFQEDVEKMIEYIRSHPGADYEQATDALCEIIEEVRVERGLTMMQRQSIFGAGASL